MIELLRYGIWILGIMQIADILTWILKKTVTKIKKGDPVWKKVSWGITGILLISVLIIGKSTFAAVWLYYSEEGMTNYEKLEMVMIYLADIKYFRLLYNSYTYLRQKAGKDMTNEEKIGFGLACWAGVVITLAIYTLMKFGIMLALLFVGILLLVIIFAKPITFIIKK